ncbi:beta-adducin-like isoform X1 [Lagopus leucura]|uniref:beta-adducin-like isoform X1 n=1 Tax=Lagopus leucura TaxID=30410 RepID=UPI001C681106|nr:beta-adducin-like isoform X1 [Lagopus leucura]
MCLLGLPLKAMHLLRFPLDDMHLLDLLPPCHACIVLFPCIYLGFFSQYHPCIRWGLLLITCNYWGFLSPCHESTWLCSPCPASLDVSPFLSAQWLKADEVEKGSSGTAIRIENPNQFVPLYTDPQEVLEMRNKIREQNRQDVKSAGPQSQLLASVIAETSRSPSTESHLGDAETKNPSQEEVPAEPEPPNPFSQLTDQELEEYKREVERKKLGLHGDKEEEETQASPPKSPPGSPKSPNKSAAPEGLEGDKKVEDGQAPADSSAEKEPPAVVNGKDEEQSTEESKGGDQTSTPANPEQDAPKEKSEMLTSTPVSPEGSPSKSPSKKKKKFRTPSFLKKGKKKEKIES